MTPTHAHAGTRQVVRSEAGALYKGTVLAITASGVFMEIEATKLGDLDWVSHRREIRHIVGTEIVSVEA